MDTGPIVAYLDVDDPSHEVVSTLFNSLSATLCTTSAVITEAMHLLESDRNGPRRLADFVKAVSLQIFESTQPEQLFAAADLMSKYSNVPMDFADATLVLLADEIRSTEVTTLDRRGFTVYRTVKGKTFRISPARSLA